MPLKKFVQISGRKLQKVRLSFALSQAELGQSVGVSGSRITQIEGMESVGVYPKFLRGLAVLMKLSPDEAKVKLAPEPPLADLNVETYSETPVGEIPLLELPIAAGKMTELPDAAEYNDPRHMNLRRFRVRIRGESMEKEYPDGSTVEFVCLQHRPDGTSDAMRIGEDYYVQSAECATFKRLKDFTNDEYVFIAVNKKKFPDEIRLKRDEVTRMARADAIIKKIPRK